jgi:hypothetical protein
MGFHDLLEHVAENVFHNTGYFAETVCYRNERDEIQELTVTLRYSVTEDRQRDGNATQRETLQVGILRSDLPDRPTFGCRIYRGADERAYIFAADNGKEQLHRWKCRFVRTIKTGQASR